MENILCKTGKKISCKNTDKNISKESNQSQFFLQELNVENILCKTGKNSCNNIYPITTYSLSFPMAPSVRHQHTPLFIGKNSMK